MTNKEALRTAIEIMTEYVNEQWDKGQLAGMHTELAINVLKQMHSEMEDEMEDENVS